MSEFCLLLQFRTTRYPNPFPAIILVHIVIVLMVFSSCSKDAGQEGENKSKNQQGTLFSLLDPKESGLYFINELREDEQLNILTYEYTYNGAGVAIGDINKDNLPDVFLTGNLFGGRIYLNKGGLQFEQISETAGVFINGYSTGVSMIDINNDGYKDIYICRSLSNNPDLRANVLLVNNQNLTFTDRAAEYGLDDKSFSQYASFFDYDNDGDLDMYLLNHRIDFENALTLKVFKDKDGKQQLLTDSTYKYVSDRLYRNEGTGKFTDVTHQAGLINRGFGLSVTVSDINKDGWTDIYVANDYGDKDYFYINNGDDTFTDNIDNMFKHMSRNAMGSDIADFNNDGHPDLINLDMVAEDNFRQKQLKGQEPYDMYHLAVELGLSHQVMRNTLQLNNGNGSFSEIGQLAGVSHTDWSWTPLFADFDNDGFKDLFITNGLYRDLTDLDYTKYDSNEALKNMPPGEPINTLQLTKLMKSTPVSNYVYRNNGDLTFANATESWGLSKPSHSNGSVYADLDQDGDLDLIVNNQNSEAFLYQNNANQLENKFISIILKGVEGNPDGLGAKVTLTAGDQTQYLENSPYRGYLGSGGSTLHFGVGKNEIISEIIVEWPGGKVQKLQNVPVNQRLLVSIKDAVDAKEVSKGLSKPLFTKLSNRTSPSFVHREDDFIDFKREALLEHMLSNKGPFMAKGDINGNGLEDVYIGGSAGHPGSLLIQQSNGTFSNQTLPSFQADKKYEDGQAVFLDMEGDGDLDLFVASGGYAFPTSASEYKNRWYKNDGEGNFSQVSTSDKDPLANSTSVTSGDFDGDGDEDLFIGGGTLPGSYPYSDKSQLLIREGQQWVDATDLLPNKGDLGMVNDAVWIADLKGKSGDLILAGEWMPISVLHFESGRFEDKTNEAGLSQSSGWWNCLTAADMDNDGDMDLIAGNRGENSFYKATIDRPAEIYANDFDNNGSIDAFPFYYFSDGQSHPKHILDEVSQQYRALKKKFRRYEAYSNATVNDMFSKEELKGALHLYAHTFSSSYLENDGNGSFSIHPLANRAQFSEVHGILPLDINKDGHMDLVLTGNNYGTDVETGRSDASVGLVLIGDGQGDFEPLSIEESGFYVDGDGRRICIVPQSNQRILLHLTNQGPSDLFIFNNNN